MRGNGIRHGRFGHADVMAAHDALKFGEFANHAADKICLGQPRGARGGRRVTPLDMPGDGGRKRLEPHGLVMD